VTLNNMRPLCLFALLLCASLSAPAADFPEAQISNGTVTAKLYLPDAEKGYYRGTRFDWSGQVYSLTTGGHEYFGQWFEKYDPKLHDAIMGPVEEFFDSPGYDEAKPGETFVRIGVGTLRKREEREFRRFGTYDIVDAGKWTTKPGKDRIEFTHELTGPNGYAYRYTKTMRLDGKKPRLVIEHKLRNTGQKAIASAQYNHNFFVIDAQPTGPGVKVTFPFDLKAIEPFKSDAGEVRGREIVYNKELQPRQSVFGLFEGGPVYDVRMEHAKAGAGVHITGDRPVSRIVYWSIRTTFCPEPYVDLRVEPGQETSWTYTYNFYNLK
jgi:hypothetical protein